jgi:hypothetical protein
VSDKKTLIEFPCRFPVKAMGRSNIGIENTVFGIVSKHVPDLSKQAVKIKASSNGRFTSVTVDIMAESKQQLDELYMELSSHPDVLYAL